MTKHDRRAAVSGGLRTEKGKRVSFPSLAAPSVVDIGPVHEQGKFMARLKAILNGAGRLLDFRGTLRSEKRRRVQDAGRRFAARGDARALAGDWAKVGQDIQKAMSMHQAQ